MYNFNIKTICINLKRREDRLQNFIKNCLIENVKIFNAIDGKTINWTNWLFFKSLLFMEKNIG